MVLPPAGNSILGRFKYTCPELPASVLVSCLRKAEQLPVCYSWRRLYVGSLPSFLLTKSCRAALGTVAGGEQVTRWRVSVWVPLGPYPSFSLDGIPCLPLWVCVYLGDGVWPHSLRSPLWLGIPGMGSGSCPVKNIFEFDWWYALKMSI